MSAINVNSITGRTGSHGPVLTGVTTVSGDLIVGSGLSVTGISTFSNTVVGGATTELVVTGDARVTGILTVGTASVTLNGTDGTITGINTINGLSFPSTGQISNRNIVINGGMRIAQRGTSGTTSSAGSYPCVDRWKCNDGGIADFTVSQSSETPVGFTSSVKWDCTTTGSNTNDAFIEQLIEGQDLQHLAYGTSSAKSITVSFWVRSNKTGEYSFWVENNSANRYYTTEGYTINTADTWEYKTITFPGDTNASGSFNNDNGIGFKLRWHLVLRASFQGTPSGNWETSASNRGQSNCVNLADSTDNEWYMTGVQVEVGDRATPFEHRSYGDELAKCERYFEVIGGRSESFMGYAYASASAAVSIRYRTVKRAIPGTITLAAAGQSTGQVTFLTAGGSYPSSTGNNTVEVITAQGFRVTGSSYSGLNSNSPSNFYVTGSAGQTTTIAEVDAEL